MAHPFTVVEYPGLALAWSDEWPGLVANADSAASLGARVPLAIAEYAAWLTGHGEPGPEGTAWRTSTVLDSKVEGPTAGDPCYPSDLQPLARADFERFLRHVTCAQADLRAEAAVPELLLDWAPEGVTPERADPWAPDLRTIHGILSHTLQLDVFYREGLRDGRAAGIFERVGPVQEEQEQTLTVIETAATRGLDRVWRPLRVTAAGSPAEPAGDWTLRKAIRRMVSHNRAHTAEIEQRKAWVLLGLPRAR